MSCPEEDTLLQYLDGALTEQQRKEVEEHLAGCPSCRAALPAGIAPVGSRETTTPMGTPPDMSSELEPDPEPNNRHRWEGAAIGKSYRAERYIGGGGMGEVYEASHRRINRRFAIKLLHHAMVDANYSARLKREAEVTSQLKHPNVVEVIDFDVTDDGTPYIVMELLEGEPLSAVLRRQKGPDRALFKRVLLEVTDAMQAVHDRGVIHRDLKPSNIFVCAGPDAPIKVMDFGISKLLDATGELTAHTVMMGTPSYMAPELAQGRAIDATVATDIFSLGAVLFRQIALAPPFIADSVPGIVYKVVHEPPTSTPYWEVCPQPLRKALLGALEKSPSKRPQSMEELRTNVQRALTKSSFSVFQSVVTSETMRGEIAPSFAAKTTPRWLWPVAGLGLLSVFAAGWLTVSLLQEESTRPKPVAQANADGTAADTSEKVATAVSPPDQGAPDQSLGKPLVITAQKQPPRIRRRTPHYGSLTIQSRDRHGNYRWGNVYLDGKMRGQTLLTLPRVRTGRHRVSVRRSGFRSASRRVVVRRGKRTRVIVELRRK